MDLNNTRVTHSDDLEEDAEYHIEFQCHFIYKFIKEYNGTYTFTNKMYWFGDNVVVCKFKNLENIQHSILKNLNIIYDKNELKFKLISGVSGGYDIANVIITKQISDSEYVLK